MTTRVEVLGDGGACELGLAKIFDCIIMFIHSLFDLSFSFSNVLGATFKACNDVHYIWGEAGKSATNSGFDDVPHGGGFHCIGFVDVLTVSTQKGWASCVAKCWYFYGRIGWIGDLATNQHVSQIFLASESTERRFREDFAKCPARRD